MAVHQLPAEVAAFTGWLSETAGRLTPGEGWYGVFSARDPAGLRACFAGADVLPWDVVESLLQDLDEPLDGARALRGRALHEAAATAHDRAAPGGAEALAERRELMRREARHAETRVRELTDRPDPDATSLAWAHDDLRRARARVTELTARLTRLAPTGPYAGSRGQHPAAVPTAPAGSSAPRASASTTPTGPPAPTAATGPSVPTTSAGSSAPTTSVGPSVPTAPSAPTTSAPPATASAPPAARRRPRGARYAWLEDADPSPAVGVPVAALPMAPASAPRGARFGGASAAAGRAPAPVAREVADDSGQAARAAGNAVYALRRLRAQGRSGEAHALLCEALAGPPAWLPVLAAELHGAGLAADWATLLWEAATLPPARLAAVAGALADAGRPHDCDQLLRQGVARPVEELAGACAALYAEGHHAEALALLTAFVRCRTPEDAARLAAADPGAGREADPAVLTAGLLAAARSVSPSRERDVLHALRVARVV
ncbi:UL36 very large tegument protein [Streptomyces sp. NPDC012769]|uniref:UL36 very large tegument protein n=1 Tax=Streptomyces sp. NPDC012769 TaxID=3364848 RepID=UPI00367649ED